MASDPRRLEAAAAGDFVIALYNPRSLAPLLRSSPMRRTSFSRAAVRKPPSLIARNLGRAGESWRVASLHSLARADIDMLTIVIVGNSATRVIDGDPPRLYTPRGYGKK